MKLDLFNPWRDLSKVAGFTLQYQTTKKGGAFSTYIRDKESQKPITFGLSRTSKEESQQRAMDSLKRIGSDGIKQAIETGQMVRPTQSVSQPPAEAKKDVDWRDGSNHRYRAQRDLVQ